MAVSNARTRMGEGAERGSSKPRTRLRGREERRPVLVFVFLLSLCVPLILTAGSLRLDPYRVVLLLIVAPVMIRWIQGGGGRLIAPDFLIIGYILWASLALLVNHGIGQTWQAIGILAAETLGPYFLARIMIRSETDYRYFASRFLALITILAALGFVESTTGFRAPAALLDPIGTVYPTNRMEPRWGLNRAQGPFQHAILFGMFCATGFALAYYLLARQRLFRAFGVCAPVVLGTFSSLSSGAFVAMMMQVFLIGWDRITVTLRQRWRILGGASILFYLIIDVLSNRTPFTVLIDYITFNAGAAYNRVHIWEYGTAEVQRHPLFGIGLNDWVRPSWMVDSVDNFWLLTAMRYGLPAFLMMTVAVIMIMRRIGAAGVADDRLGDAHKAFLISLTGLIIGICTVHLWGPPYSLFFFLLGSGVWMIDQARMAESSTSLPRRVAERPRSPSATRPRPSFGTRPSGATALERRT